MKLGLRWLGSIITCLAVVSLCLPLSGEMVDQQNCWQTAEEIRSQADALEAGAQGLPETYRELIQLPLQLRKEVFRRLPMVTQVEVWRSHLRTFLDQDLTPEQRGALVAFIEALSPDILAALTENRISETSFAKNLDAMAEVFDKEQFIAMTVRLGEAGECSGAP